MRTITKITVALFVITAFAFNVKAQPVETPTRANTTPITKPTTARPTTTTSTTVPTVYKHGDCSWIAPIALSVGWKPKQIPDLVHIISRESGCCPRRIGGSVVDKDCNFIRMATMTHRSDTGLLQINGVHWKQDHKQYAGLVCKKMGVCSQEPLLDPVVNLTAGRLLFDVAGWQPWKLSTE